MEQQRKSSGGFSMINPFREQGVTVGVAVLFLAPHAENVAAAPTSSHSHACKAFLFFKFGSLLLQLICELLALKNDVCSWLKKRSMVGVSRKSGEKITHCRAQSFLDCFQPASCVSTDSPVALPRHPADLPAPAGGDQPAGAAPCRTGSLCGGIQDVPSAEAPEGSTQSQVVMCGCCLPAGVEGLQSLPHSTSVERLQTPCERRTAPFSVFHPFPNNKRDPVKHSP